MRRGLLRMPVRPPNIPLQAGIVLILQDEPEAIDRAIARMVEGKTAITTDDG